MTDDNHMTPRQRLMDLNRQLDSALFWRRSFLALLILSMTALTVFVAIAIVLFLEGTLYQVNVTGLFISSLSSCLATLANFGLFTAFGQRVKNINRQRQDIAHQYPLGMGD